MKGNGDGKIELDVVEMGKGRMMVRPGITPTTDMSQVPTAINDVPIDWF